MGQNFKAGARGSIDNPPTPIVDAFDVAFRSELETIELELATSPTPTPTPTDVDAIVDAIAIVLAHGFIVHHGPCATTSPTMRASSIVAKPKADPTIVHAWLVELETIHGLTRTDVATILGRSTSLISGASTSPNPNAQWSVEIFETHCATIAAWLVARDAARAEANAHNAMVELARARAKLS